MPNIVNILWLIIGTLVILTMGFGIAVILVPEFRDSTATAALIAAILMPLTTAASIMGGIVLSKGVGQAIAEETQPTDTSGEEGANGA